MGNIVEVEVEDGGRVRLPEEAMALFSGARKLYLLYKNASQTGRVESPPRIQSSMRNPGIRS